MRSVFGWSVLSIAMLFATMSASDRANAAGLSLVVDSTTKTLWFDGSDSGILDGASGYFSPGFVDWGTYSGGGTSLNTSSAINATFTPGWSLGSFYQSIEIDSSSIAIASNVFYVNGPGSASWNFQGKGSSAAISYAGLSSALQSRLESLATSNTQLSVIRGTAGNSLKMSLYSSGGSGGGGGEVPEPTSMAIFGLSALGVCLPRKTQKQGVIKYLPISRKSCDLTDPSDPPDLEDQATSLSSPPHGLRPGGDPQIGAIHFNTRKSAFFVASKCCCH